MRSAIFSVSGRLSIVGGRWHKGRGPAIIEAIKAKS